MARTKPIEGIGQNLLGRQTSLADRNKKNAQIWGGLFFGVGVANYFIRQKANERLAEFAEGKQGLLNDASNRFREGMEFWNNHANYGKDWEAGYKKEYLDNVFRNIAGKTSTELSNPELFDQQVNYDLVDDIAAYKKKMVAMAEFKGYKDTEKEETRYLSGINHHLSLVEKAISSRKNVASAIGEALNRRPSTKLADVEIGGRTIRMPEDYIETPDGEILKNFFQEQLDRVGLFNAATNSYEYDESQLTGPRIWDFLDKTSDNPFISGPPTNEKKYMDLMGEYYGNTGFITAERRKLGEGVKSMEQQSQTKITVTVPTPDGMKEVSILYLVASLPDEVDPNSTNRVSPRKQFVHDIARLAAIREGNYEKYWNKDRNGKPLILGVDTAALPTVPAIVIQEALNSLQRHIQIDGDRKATYGFPSPSVLGQYSIEGFEQLIAEDEDRNLLKLGEEFRSIDEGRNQIVSLLPNGTQHKDFNSLPTLNQGSVLTAILLEFSRRYQAGFGGEWKDLYEDYLPQVNDYLDSIDYYQ